MWWGGFSEHETTIMSLLFVSVLIPMWWGGFSERLLKQILVCSIHVLIPMWWGGFSEQYKAETPSAFRKS